MRALPCIKFRSNFWLLLGCLAIFTALALLSDQMVRPATATGSPDSAVQVPQNTFPGTGVGAIPDGLNGVPPQFGPPLVISFAVNGVTGPVTQVSIAVTLTHAFGGDLEMILRAPGGAASLVLVSRMGVTTANGFGFAVNLLGTYNFTDTAAGTNIWTAAVTNPIPAGAYRTTGAGGAGQTNPPPVTSLNSTFSGLGAGANGTWTLTIRDAAIVGTGSVTAANLTIVPPGNSAQKPPFDFDGDGKTDYAVVRNVGGTLNWFLQRSASGFLGQSWGTANDLFVPGDYDGDGKWDIAVWRPGTPAVFYIFRTSTGTLQTVAFGQTFDDPRVTQDFDGDNLADPAVTRNVGGTLIWYILRSSLGFTAVSFGVPGDASIRGDFDGDGKADLAVYRTNTFYVLRSSNGGVQAQTFGDISLDYVIPADFDGDGKTDYAVWRAGNGVWYWLQSSDGGFRALNFGMGVDRPVPGDYDGDGKSDQAVWRPGTPANFYVNRSTSGFFGFPFGQTGDEPPSTTLQTR